MYSARTRTTSEARLARCMRLDSIIVVIQWMLQGMPTFNEEPTSSKQQPGGEEDLSSLVHHGPLQTSR